MSISIIFPTLDFSRTSLPIVESWSYEKSLFLRIIDVKFALFSLPSNEINSVNDGILREPK